jgi:hypothetical protein
MITMYNVTTNYDDTIMCCSSMECAKEAISEKSKKDGTKKSQFTIKKRHTNEHHRTNPTRPYLRNRLRLL